HRLNKETVVAFEDNRGKATFSGFESPAVSQVAAARIIPISSRKMALKPHRPFIDRLASQLALI
ncbi:hypothetical protein A2U01_0107713, partial [Trifolium medium]|nr:hypothetical protein [Trifolium medium]